MSTPLPRFDDYQPEVPEGGPDASERGSPGPAGGAEPWHRLSIRMIWVDAAQSVLSLMPGALAVWVFGVEPTAGNLWPLAVIAVLGVVGAIGDALRWVFTRYRVTPDYVERRTGLFVRQYRSVRRDRIRSVDTSAKLRHRLAGLRVVNIGAGQQSSAGESAFVLDAIAKADAEELRRELLWARGGRSSAVDVLAGDDGPAGSADGLSGPAGSAADGSAGSAGSAGQHSLPAAERPPGEEVFARLRPSWVVYNMFNVWAYLMAAGLLWGGFWLASTFGFDVVGFLGGLADWETLGWGWTIVVAVVVTGAVGVIGLGLNFFTEYWNFELARVPGEKGTLLRTRRGLFQTREVNRDDNRMRGLEISEPVLWRWMGMADTNVITTGLDMWGMSQPSTILPRGPITVARPVAGAVLDVAESPFEVPLERHPRAALRRRLWWATLVAGAVTGVLTWLAVTDVLPGWTVWAGVGLWPLALLAAVIAYRALGHAIVGDYLVTRSGLMSRSTAALKRHAVSTIALRESVLQRRLGLKTVSAMTAAGWGIYEAPDVDAETAVAFAADAAPGLLDPFLERPAPDGKTSMPLRSPVS